jgi:hypothetical protein
MTLSDFFEARRYLSTSATMGAIAGPMSGLVRREVNDMKFGDGRRAITDGIIEF